MKPNKAGRRRNRASSKNSTSQRGYYYITATIRALSTAEASAMLPFMAFKNSRRDLTRAPTISSCTTPAIFPAPSICRGQLELRINKDLPNPTLCIVTCCELGEI
jgi:hypothetical protein